MLLRVYIHRPEYGDVLTLFRCIIPVCIHSLQPTSVHSLQRKFCWSTESNKIINVYIDRRNSFLFYQRHSRTRAYILSIKVYLVCYELIICCSVRLTERVFFFDSSTPIYLYGECWMAVSTFCFIVTSHFLFNIHLHHALTEILYSNERTVCHHLDGMNNTSPAYNVVS